MLKGPACTYTGSDEALHSARLLVEIWISGAPPPPKAEVITITSRHSVKYKKTNVICKRANSEKTGRFLWLQWDFKTFQNGHKNPVQDCAAVAPVSHLTPFWANDVRSRHSTNNGLTNCIACNAYIPWAHKQCVHVEAFKASISQNDFFKHRLACCDFASISQEIWRRVRGKPSVQCDFMKCVTAWFVWSGYTGLGHNGWNNRYCTSFLVWP
jgi:hypothetical protein